MYNAGMKHRCHVAVYSSPDGRCRLPAAPHLWNYGPLAICARHHAYFQKDDPYQAPPEILIAGVMRHGGAAFEWADLVLDCQDKHLPWPTYDEDFAARSGYTDGESYQKSGHKRMLNKSQWWLSEY